MSQSDFGTIDPATKNGTILASDLNGLRDAVNSNHYYASAPAYKVQGMTWVNSALAERAYEYWDGTKWIKLFGISESGSGSMVIGSLTALSVIEGAGNTGVADADADTLVVKGAGATGISILNPNSSTSNLYFGGVLTPSAWKISYTDTSKKLKLGSSVASSNLTIHTGVDIEAFTIDNSQRIGVRGAPASVSTFHVATASSGTSTYPVSYDDVIFEGTGTYGMCMLTNTAGTSGYTCGSQDATSAMSMFWNDSSDIGVIGTGFGTADLQITYGNGSNGMYFNGTNDYIGVRNGAPESGFHFGSPFPSNWDTIAAEGAIMFNSGTNLTRMTISSSEFVSFQLINTGWTGTDSQMFAINLGTDGVTSLKSVGDKNTSSAYATKHTFIKMHQSSGRVDIVGTNVYLPDLADTTDKFLKIEANTGKIILS